MGSVYSFYIGKQNIDNKELGFVGPYYFSGNDIKVVPVVEVSGSTIDVALRDSIGWSVSEDRVGGLFSKNIMGYTDPDGNWHSCSYYNIVEDFFYADDPFFFEGYVKKEEAKDFLCGLDNPNKEDSNEFFIHYMAPGVIPASYVAGLSSIDRDEYIHIAYIDKLSSGWFKEKIRNELAIAAKADPLNPNERWVIITVIK